MPIIPCPFIVIEGEPNTILEDMIHLPWRMHVFTSAQFAYTFQGIVRDFLLYCTA